jgi:anti-sigma factor RsiW
MTAPVPSSGQSAEPAVNRIRAQLVRSHGQWIGVTGKLARRRLAGILGASAVFEPADASVVSTVGDQESERDAWLASISPSSN